MEKLKKQKKSYSDIHDIISTANELINIIEKNGNHNNIVKLLDQAVQEYQLSKEKGTKSMLQLFGGMGSLNDIYIKNQQEREKFELLMTTLHKKLKA